LADDKRYYYLKLKDNFFDSDAMIVLESMPDGYLYSNILLKLYLRSLKFKGKLMFNERIPYNSTVLAQVTRHNVGVVEKALKVLQELGLIEILDNGAIYMIDIQNFIGTSSTEADRKKIYRERIELEKGQMSGQMSDKRPPKKEIEKELELDIDKDQKKNNKAEINSMFETLWKAYPKKEGKGQVKDKQKKVLYNIGPDEMLRTIERYKAEKIGVEKQYIKNGSTFFNSGYIDYLDANYELDLSNAEKEEKPKTSGYEGRGY